jgi:hypothetical protein
MAGVSSAAAPSPSSAMCAPTDQPLQAVLHKIITRTMKQLTHRGVLVEEQAKRTWPTTTAIRMKPALDDGALLHGDLRDVEHAERSGSTTGCEVRVPGHG